MPYSDPEKYKQYQKDYRRKNEKKLKRRAKEYRGEHVEEIHRNNAEHWAKEKNSPRRRESEAFRFHNYHRRLRMAALEHYGGVCACCGEDTYEFLSIDHIDGGGTKHKEKVGRGNTFIRWLRNNDYPIGFRVLCHNCNQALGAYGYCPHQIRKEVVNDRLGH